MELLAGYASSSSSSSSTSSFTRSRNRNDAVLTSCAHNAHHVAASEHSFGVGADGDRSASKACNDGKLRYSNRRTGSQYNGKRGTSSSVGSIETQLEKNQDIDVGAKTNDDINSHMNKKRKVVPSQVEKNRKYVRVVIFGCDQNGSSDNDILSNSDQPKFERSHPHWEGRWTGHLHFPFPPLASMDMVATRNTISLNEQLPNIPESNDFRSSVESSSSSEEGSSSEDEDSMPQSRFFLPTARTLIHHWARILGEACNNAEDATTGCDHKDETKSAIVIVPHIPMRPIETTIKSHASQPPFDESTPATSLHISLARPIYLPTPSVDPFLADIEKGINNVISIAKKSGPNSHIGKTLHLQPYNATIFSNDQQTRSFLSVPVSKEGARWVKQLLIPPIDATMLRFGLQTYYSTEEEGCILHVSIASVKGNIIPQILRRNGAMDESGFENTETQSKIRSIPLFSREERDQGPNMPRSIPISVNQIQCDFGKTKQLAIPI
ncbi:hypothetical protein ACHAXR_008070 [Thalassiosira sp. AJA248-18]